MKLALVGLCLALVFLGIYDVAAPHVRRKTNRAPGADRARRP